MCGPVSKPPADPSRAGACLAARILGHRPRSKDLKQAAWREGPGVRVGRGHDEGGAEVWPGLLVGVWKP